MSTPLEMFTEQGWDLQFGVNVLGAQFPPSHGRSVS